MKQPTIHDPYSQCHCGSNRKYKFCCLDKDKDDPKGFDKLPITTKYSVRFGEDKTFNITTHYCQTKDNVLNNCLECGECCGIDNILDIDDNGESYPKEWLAPNKVNPYKLDMKRHPNGRCILQDQSTNKCCIYNDPRKPKICSEFVRGSHHRCYSGELVKLFATKSFAE
jgi:hypothetical protein